MSALRNVGWSRLPWWPGEKKRLAEAEARVGAALKAAEKTYTKAQVRRMLSEVIADFDLRAQWANNASSWQAKQSVHRDPAARMYGESLGREAALREAADQLRELRGLLQ
jgi:hypothetical protein